LDAWHDFLINDCSHKGGGKKEGMIQNKKKKKKVIQDDKRKQNTEKRREKRRETDDKKGKISEKKVKSLNQDRIGSPFLGQQGRR
jgi:hypothetical protein